jgi:hypothetical protein
MALKAFRDPGLKRVSSAKAKEAALSRLDFRYKLRPNSG